MIEQLAPQPTLVSTQRGTATLEIRHLVRNFGSIRALAGVDLRIDAGQIHAVLGPNGAGKTTLVRTVIGLAEPSSGSVLVLGRPLGRLGDRRGRERVALVPSGDRTFYMRLSGYENLLFFARLLGLPTRQAKARVRECLDDVGLLGDASRPVAVYSHGMQKRLSVARALLGQPALLLVDESTHDLDPEAARRVQELVAATAREGTAVLWATQRLDEIRAFADRVTVLRAGQVRFTGTVPELLSLERGERYVVRLRPRYTGGRLDTLSTIDAVVGDRAVVERLDTEHVVVELAPGVVLGHIITDLTQGGIDVLACREERSGVESAFLKLVQSESS